MTEREQTRYLVTLPLTDEQADILSMGMDAMYADITDGFSKRLMAIGTPVPESGLEMVAWGLEGDAQPGKSFIAWPRPPCSVDMWNVALVRRTDAEALIAARDAEIAELRARLETIAQETREACAKIIEQNVEATALRGGRRFLLPRTDGDQVALAYAAAIRSAGEKV
ncbi:hypothetical protein Gdia_2496 [Gluconacetobacter diazotrophicus PA1 5]|uniref:hypothetical protein n=1 Tax=Gluconacetobacter diazotrophicus TaxID=33996 RepID=UPI000173DB7B|nr:hypothetical protein [Gluconacetobacter diazotrophicus]ACI52240.1 hypothetical protein Gdia_2496 [Gluconacetobacter diazotrophicus PA1 5]